jgi:alpha-glucosidase (family GH31 glycosyl hydrolase)
VECGDQYLWGKSLLVTPVVEKGATARLVYLPPGTWYDFWTNESIEGGRAINRPVDLETLPLYVRAGSILPLGPIKQFVSEKVDAPLSISIYPGSDATFLLYEDDGTSFNYRNGDWMGIQMNWNDAHKKLDLALASGSHMLSPEPRAIEVQLSGITKTVHFNGKPISVSFA